MPAKAVKKLYSGKLIVGVIAFLGLMTIVSGTWHVFLSIEGPLAGPTSVIVGKGASLGQIANKLEKAGVVSSSFMFKLATKGTFMSRYLQAGEYEFEAGDSLNKVVYKLSSGKVVQRSITFPEGMTTAEIVAKLKANPNLSGPIPPLNEGTLLPETYSYTKGERRIDVIRRMASEMNKVLMNAWQNRDKSVPLMTPDDLVTLASIVEKETNLDRERARVAGVYVNRLHKGMRLQADPTVIYGASNYDGNITKKHLREKHPYNTYVIKGLPKGPIANPGAASLLASANPEMHNYLYFVADAKGGHWFAETNAEHSKNVKRYLKEYRKLHKKK